MRYDLGNTFGYGDGSGCVIYVVMRFCRYWFGASRGAALGEKKGVVVGLCIF